jgi:threonine dehydratase
VHIRVKINDELGVLERICGTIGEQGRNIIEIYHHQLLRGFPIKLAELDAVVETCNAQHVNEIIGALDAAGLNPGHSAELRQRAE